MVTSKNVSGHVTISWKIMGEDVTVYHMVRSSGKLSSFVNERWACCMHLIMSSLIRRQYNYIDTFSNINIIRSTYLYISC